MRTLLFIALLCLSCYIVPGQTKVKQLPDGNYMQVSAQKSEPVSTGKFLVTPTGEKLPVYKSSTGKLFVVRTSKKTGKTYHQYLLTH